MKKIIVVDLDGTLLNSKKEISKKSKEYLLKLKKLGYVIVIATGRILASALHATNDAKFANFIISNGGAVLYDVKRKEILSSKTIPEEMILKIWSTYDKTMSTMRFCASDKIYMCGVVDDIFSVLLKNNEELQKISSFIHHVSISFYQNEDVTKYYQKIEQTYPLRVGYMKDSKKDRYWIEIHPKNCSKYQEIELLAKKLEIPNKNIIAFGDSLNDIEMLEKCGIGVAMKNAVLEAKEKANFITKYTNEEDGVVEFLKDYIEEEKKF